LEFIVDQCVECLDSKAGNGAGRKKEETTMPEQTHKPDQRLVFMRSGASLPCVYRHSLHRLDAVNTSPSPQIARKIDVSMKVLIYVSGHGFGHLTRMIALLRALQRLQPEIQVFVRGNLIPDAQKMIEAVDGVVFEKTIIDAGMIELDLYHQDVAATLDLYYDHVFARESEILDTEVAWVHGRQIDIVVSDTPPLAAVVARRAGVPHVAIGNFTWDFIYSPYIGEAVSLSSAAVTPLDWGRSSKYLRMLGRIRECYAAASHLLYLPLSEPMHAFGAETVKREPIPLMVRQRTASPEQTKADLRLDTRPVILWAVRGSIDLEKDVYAGIRANLQNLAEDCQLLSTFDPKVPFIRNVSADTENAWMGERFRDLVSAADVVVAKLGYGIASECIASRTPLLYPPRYQFAEFPVLEAAIQPLVPSATISRGDFEAGNWKQPIASLLELKVSKPWPDVENDGDGPGPFVTTADIHGPRTIRTDGAAVAARRILEIAEAEPRQRAEAQQA
jgi:hypothetical protein